MKQLSGPETRVHFIGIGGIGMCGLAQLLHSLGAQVTGSDLGENRQTRALKSLGVSIETGHDPKNIEGADVVVYSSAVRPENPEYKAALQFKIPLIRRAEALADLMSLKRGIAIAGTHGKTTTTSLVSTLFLESKRDPTIVVGGRLEALDGTAMLGQGEWFIAEADESDGSFNRLSPEIVVITNIDRDHLDHYGSFDNLRAAFVDFALRIPFYGTLVYCGDDPNCRELFHNFPKRCVSYGFGAHNSYLLEKTDSGYRMKAPESDWVEFESPLPGQHNALNGAASLITASLAGLEITELTPYIAGFKGVDRRFQLRAQDKDCFWYDDYGHHPSEISAALQALKERFPGHRRIVLFQPHRYTRTKICWDDFLKCFHDLDQLFIVDIYAAGEKPLAGVDSVSLARGVQGQCEFSCQYLDLDSAQEKHAFLQLLDEKCVLLSLGAGHINKLAEKLWEERKAVSS